MSGLSAAGRADTKAAGSIYRPCCPSGGTGGRRYTLGALPMTRLKAWLNALSES